MPASEQGIFPDQYNIIPRTLVFLSCSDRILLLKGASTKRIWPNKYNGIGGHIEQGEDALTSARRELFEETRLTVSDLWLCGVVLVDTATTPGIGIFVFKGECPQGSLAPSIEGNLVWIPKNDLYSYPLVEDLFTLLPKVLSCEKGDPPFSVLYQYDQEDKLEIKFGE
jgi:8-oxo-dGTP diphosphatase